MSSPRAAGSAGGGTPRADAGRGPATVGQIGEFGLIRTVTARMPTGTDVLLGPGDDAAVVAAPDGRVVVTTDLVVEGRHFRRAWSTGYDVGRKAAARNLADVAAMGARPTALVVGLATPPDLPVSWAEQLADGLRDECGRVGASVAGGDVSSADVVMLGVTALGDLGGRPPVRRDGARPGDTVVLAGRTGWAEAGLALLAAGLADPPELAELVEAHRRPRPPYRMGPVLAAAGAHAMCDVSDGLLADLGHIARASGVTVDLRSSAFEPADALRRAAERLGVDPLAWMLTGGDDHALVACLPPDVPVPDGCTVIGAVLAPAAGRETAAPAGAAPPSPQEAAPGTGEPVLVDGRRYDRPPGWEHFHRSG